MKLFRIKIDEIIAFGAYFVEDELPIFDKEHKYYNYNFEEIEI